MLFIPILYIGVMVKLYHPTPLGLGVGITQTLVKSSVKVW